MSFPAHKEVSDLLFTVRSMGDGLKIYLDQLGQQLNLIQEKLHKQTEELQLKNGNISRLEDLVEEQDHRIISLEESVKNKANQISSLTAINSELSHQLDKEKLTVAFLTGELKTMTDLRADAVNKYEEQKVVCSSLQESSVELKEQMEELSEEFSFLKKELQTKESVYKERIASLHSAIAHKEMENKTLKERLEQLKHIKTVKDQMAQMQQVFDAKILAMLQEREKHLKELEETKNSSEQMQHSIDSLVAEKEALKSLTKDLNDELTHLREAHEVQLAELKQSYEGNLKEQSSELLYIREEVEELSERIGNMLYSENEPQEVTFQEY